MTSTLLFLALAGCSGGADDDKSGQDSDDRVLDTGDTAVADCTDHSVEVGRCGVQGSLAQCTGNAGESQIFVPVDDGDPVGIVTGFQGARMFALAARVGGIDPGTPGDAPDAKDPLVDTIVRRAEHSVVGRQRSWMAFGPDPDDPALYLVTQLYVQLEGEVPVRSGQTLTAEVLVTDADGVVKCGAVEFVAE